jgi:hypothetical protein
MVFFPVTNPFLCVVHVALQLYGGGGHVLEALTSMFHAVRFRSHQFPAEPLACLASGGVGSGVEYTLAQSRQEREQFLVLMTELLAGEEGTESEARRRSRWSQFFALFDSAIGTSSVSEEEASHPAVKFVQILADVPTEVKTVINDIGMCQMEASIVSLYFSSVCECVSLCAD